NRPSGCWRNLREANVPTAAVSASASRPARPSWPHTAAACICAIATMRPKSRSRSPRRARPCRPCRRRSAAMAEREAGAVLVIEDNFSIRRLLQERLESAGQAVRTAADLAAARQTLSADRIDLVLLDLGLPDGDGVEFVREL